MKRFISILLVFSMLFSFGLATVASADGGSSPQVQQVKHLHKSQTNSMIGGGM
jgi:hypothetical protein